MRLIQQLLALIAIGTGHAVLAQDARTETSLHDIADMTIVTIEGPPLPKADGGYIASGGLGIKEAKTALAACNIKAKFTVSPSWKRGFSMATAGQVDAIIPTNKKPDRIALFHFPAKPFKKMTVVLFTQASNPVSSFSGLEEVLDGKRFGRIAGSSLETSLDAFVAAGRVRLDERTKVRALYEGLLRGRLDYVAEVLEHSAPFIRALQAEDKIKALSPPLGVIPLYIAVSKKSRFAHQPYSQKFSCLMGIS